MRQELLVRQGAATAVAVLALALGVAGCADGAPVPAPGTPAVPAEVLASASAAAAAVPRDEDLVWARQGWPDACALPAPPNGATPGTVTLGTATPGTATPGTARRGAGDAARPPDECTWPVTGPGLPPGPAPGARRLTLRIHVVTDDPYDAWGVLQFRLGLWRDVENVGDEAMLTMPVADEREELYVCTGRTIFVLAVTGPRLEVLTQRDLLYDVALRADARLRALPAGLPAALPAPPSR